MPNPASLDSLSAKRVAPAIDVALDKRLIERSFPSRNVPLLGERLTFEFLDEMGGHIAGLTHSISSNFLSTIQGRRRKCLKTPAGWNGRRSAGELAHTEHRRCTEVSEPLQRFGGVIAPRCVRPEEDNRWPDLLATGLETGIGSRVEPRMLGAKAPRTPAVSPQAQVRQYRSR